NSDDANTNKTTLNVNDTFKDWDEVNILVTSKNLQFPQAILNKIKYYTTNGHLNARQQYDLLLKDFPQHNIKKKNLYNCDSDPKYFIATQLKESSNELTGLFWMTSQ
ncbi:12025_t:CDS:2, partial [Gigaspora margarita]